MEAHTEKLKVLSECHSTSQGAEAGRTLATLWEEQTYVSPQRGGQLASFGEPGHEVAEPYQAWVQSPGYKRKCKKKKKRKEDQNKLTVSEAHV